MRFMRCALVPSLALLAVCGWSAELAPKPVVEAQLADGKDLIAHWDKTPWAKVWADPATKALHQPFEKWQADAAKQLGGTPTDLIAAIANAAFSLSALPPRAANPINPEFPVAIQAGADLGSFAATLFALAKKNGTSIPVTTVTGADEAFANTQHHESVLARFATSLAIGIQTLPTRPLVRSAPLSDDLIVHADVPGIFDLIVKAMPEGPQRESIRKSQQQMLTYGFTDAVYRMRMVPEGFIEEVDAKVAHMVGYLPVDRKLLARLPATTLMAAAVGYDGAAAWKEQRGSMLSSWAQFVGTDASDSDATEKAINAKMAELDLGVTLAELFNGLTGTSLVALSPSMPFPAMSIALPRSPAIDTLFAKGLAKLGTKPPAEGSSILIPIPNAPVSLTLVCDKTTWLASTDAQLADSWLAGTANGWIDTPAAKLALSKAPADAYLIGASDTAAVLRLIAGYAGMGLGMVKTIPADQKQAILQGINVLAANAATGYIVAGSEKGHQHTELRSITGMLPGIGIIGGVAGIMAVVQANESNLGNHRPNDQDKPEVIVDPNDPTAVLHDRILPAEVQFKNGAYRDQDANGVGEYGLLSELAGRRDVGAGNRLALIEGPLARGATAGGYSYTIYLPGGATRVADDGKAETRAPVPANANAQEKAFVAYAWPSRAKDGTMYALLASGTVYQADYLGMPPSWNAVFGGAGFDAEPIWKKAAAAGNSPAPAPTEPTPVP